MLTLQFANGYYNAEKALHTGPLATQANERGLGTSGLPVHRSWWGLSTRDTRVEPCVKHFSSDDLVPRVLNPVREAFSHYTLDSRTLTRVFSLCRAAL